MIFVIGCCHRGRWLLVLGCKSSIGRAQNGQGWKAQNRPATVVRPVVMLPIVGVPLRVRVVVRVIMVQAPRASVRPGGLPAGVGWALIAVRLGTVGVNSLSASRTLRLATPMCVGVRLLGRLGVCHVRRSSVVTLLRSVGLGGWATVVRWATSQR